MPMAPSAHALGVLLSAKILSASVFSEPALAGTGAARARTLGFGTEAVAMTDPWVNGKALAAVSAGLGWFWLMFVHQPSADQTEITFVGAAGCLPALRRPRFYTMAANPHYAGQLSGMAR